MNTVSALALTVLLLAGACSNGGDGATGAETDPSSSTATTRTLPTATPTLVDVDCHALVASITGLTCHELTVPADRSDPQSGSVTLRVGRLAPRTTPGEEDPLLFLPGGPGQVGVAFMLAFHDKDFAPNREIIALDPRGVPESRPNLECERYDDVIWQVLAEPRPATEEDQMLDQFLQYCRHELIENLPEGVDLDDFDTPTAAADVIDLRRALGIEEWNVFGLSYGTTVALEVARQDEGGIRSMVLDSVYPTDVPLSTDRLVANAQRAFGELWDACEANTRCSASHPDVRGRFDALVESFDAEPFETTVEDRDGTLRQVTITGEDIVAGLFNALYDHELIGELPLAIDQLRERGDNATAVVQQLAQSGVDQLTLFTEGVTGTVECADRSRLGVNDSLAPAPFSMLSVLGSVRCQVWDVDPVDPTFHDPVTVDVPALVFGNRFDPVTPPSDSERVADGLPSGTFVRLPTLGHGAVLAHACPQSLAETFLAEPNHRVDSACVTRMTPIIFTR